MDSSADYHLLADLILYVHALYVGFVIIGLLLIIAGGYWRWSWVRNPWFRVMHLLAIGLVILESWLGVMCPLTRWEMSLRNLAGDDVYARSFFAHWTERVLFYQAPEWVFILGYTLFGVLVMATWFWVRPRSFRKAGP